jgi:hypothetical protein
MVETNSYNQTIKDRQDKEKQNLVNILKEMPIITVAVKKVGISRDTYYRWKTEDNVFWRQCSEAIKGGIEFINDMSEAKVIQLIKDGKLPAIALWLKHNNAKYGAKKIFQLPMTPICALSPKDKELFSRALGLETEKKESVN